ncbi:MAG: DUF58 domain-containing protein [Proteobacteria bacterium]|nr:DUF58 domain-containing protein [Pseudomonadota bacterium]
MGATTSPRRSWRRTLRRWLRPPRTLRPTRAGWIFFALIFGVGFAALNTGNNLLYLVLSLMLSFLVLSGVLSEAALRGIAVRRRLPAELHAESEHYVALEIHNRQRRVASFAVAVEDVLVEPGHFGDDLAPDSATTPAGRCFALRIAPERRELRHYTLRPEIRGPLHFHAYRVSTRFPFGLFLKTMVIQAPETTLVFPAVDRVATEHTGGRERSAEAQAWTRAREGIDISGLREHRRGDPARRVHWRHSIRRAELVVRETDTEVRGEVEVHLRTSAQSSDSGFERRVRRAASEVVAHLAAQSRVALRTDRERLDAGSGTQHRRRLLAFLARVQPDPVRA